MPPFDVWLLSRDMEKTQAGPVPWRCSVRVFLLIPDRFGWFVILDGDINSMMLRGPSFVDIWIVSLLKTTTFQNNPIKGKLDVFEHTKPSQTVKSFKKQPFKKSKKIGYNSRRPEPSPQLFPPYRCMKGGLQFRGPHEILTRLQLAI